MPKLEWSQTVIPLNDHEWKLLVTIGYWWNHRDDVCTQDVKVELVTPGTTFTLSGEDFSAEDWSEILSEAELDVRIARDKGET